MSGYGNKSPGKAPTPPAITVRKTAHPPSMPPPEAAVKGVIKEDSSPRSPPTPPTAVQSGFGVVQAKILATMEKKELNAAPATATATASPATTVDDIIQRRIQEALNKANAMVPLASPSSQSAAAAAPTFTPPVPAKKGPKAPSGPPPTAVETVAFSAPLPVSVTATAASPVKRGPKPPSTPAPAPVPVPSISLSETKGDAPTVGERSPPTPPTAIQSGFAAVQAKILAAAARDASPEKKAPASRPPLTTAISFSHAIESKPVVDEAKVVVKVAPPVPAKKGPTPPALPRPVDPVIAVVDVKVAPAVPAKKGPTPPAGTPPVNTAAEPRPKKVDAPLSPPIVSGDDLIALKIAQMDLAKATTTASTVNAAVNKFKNPITSTNEAHTGSVSSAPAEAAPKTTVADSGSGKKGPKPPAGPRPADSPPAVETATATVDSGSVKKGPKPPAGPRPADSPPAVETATATVDSGKKGPKPPSSAPPAVETATATVDSGSGKKGPKPPSSAPPAVLSADITPTKAVAPQVLFTSPPAVETATATVDSGSGKKGPKPPAGPPPAVASADVTPSKAVAATSATTVDSGSGRKGPKRPAGAPPTTSPAVESAKEVDTPSAPVATVETRSTGKERRPSIFAQRRPSIQEESTESKKPKQRRPSFTDTLVSGVVKLKEVLTGRSASPEKKPPSPEKKTHQEEMDFWLEEDFHHACDVYAVMVATNEIKTTAEEQLEITALKKYSIFGPCPKDIKRPVSIIENEKVEAWLNLGQTMTKNEAKTLYVAYICRLNPSLRDFIKVTLPNTPLVSPSHATPRGDDMSIAVAFANPAPTVTSVAAPAPVTLSIPAPLSSPPLLSVAAAAGGGLRKPLSPSNGQGHGAATKGFSKGPRAPAGPPPAPVSKENAAATTSPVKKGPKPPAQAPPTSSPIKQVRAVAASNDSWASDSDDAF